MDKMILLIMQLMPLVSAGLQLFGTVQTVMGMIRKAQSEGRDLTDEELAEIDALVKNADDEWQAELDRRRQEAAAATAPQPVSS